MSTNVALGLANEPSTPKTADKLSPFIKWAGGKQQLLQQLLFEIKHPIDLYPVIGIFGDERVEMNDEKEFQKWLRSVFASTKT